MSSQASSKRRKRGTSQAGRPSLFSPSIDEESSLGHPDLLVVGLDEVGRGCLAGPVTVGAVVLPENPFCEPWVSEIRDSKLLSEAKRLDLAPRIRAWARFSSVAWASVEEIERFNILGAVGLAMQRAVTEVLSASGMSVSLKVPPSGGGFDFRILIDGNRIPSCFVSEWKSRSRTVVKGDARCLSIAAASVLAKVARDQLMSDYEKKYPGYGFAEHKSYGTPAHLEAIRAQGVLEVHRKSFAPVRALLVSAPEMR